MGHSNLAADGVVAVQHPHAYRHRNQLLTECSLQEPQNCQGVGFRRRTPGFRRIGVSGEHRMPTIRACTVGCEPDAGPGTAPTAGDPAGWDEVGRPRATRPAAGWRRRLLTSASRPDLEKRESADKPGSVVDNHPSGTRVAARLERPTRKLLRAAGTGREARVFPYLVLLQVGFAVPPNVATGAVRSYRTLSPLPSGCPTRWRCWGHLGRTCGPASAIGSSSRLGRSALCCTFRGLAPPRRYLAPCPVEPGLSSAQCAAVAWPTPAPIIRVARAARAHKGPCAPGR